MIQVNGQQVQVNSQEPSIQNTESLAGDDLIAIMEQDRISIHEIVTRFPNKLQPHHFGSHHQSSQSSDNKNVTRDQ